MEVVTKNHQYFIVKNRQYSTYCTFLGSGIVGFSIAGFGIAGTFFVEL